VGASATANRRAAQTRCPCMRRCSPSYAYRRFARVQSALCGRITPVPPSCLNASPGAEHKEA
jgi:hypothetical protein